MGKVILPLSEGELSEKTIFDRRLPRWRAARRDWSVTASCGCLSIASSR